MQPLNKESQKEEQVQWTDTGCSILHNAAVDPLCHGLTVIPLTKSAKIWVSLSSAEAAGSAPMWSILGGDTGLTWASGPGGLQPLRDKSLHPLLVQMSLEDKHTKQPREFTRRTGFLCFTWNTVSPLIPHCCRFIAARQRCTNKRAPLLARGWAKGATTANQRASMLIRCLSILKNLLKGKQFHRCVDTHSTADNYRKQSGVNMETKQHRQHRTTFIMQLLQNSHTNPWKP